MQSPHAHKSQSSAYLLPMSPPPTPKKHRDPSMQLVMQRLPTQHRRIINDTTPSMPKARARGSSCRTTARKNEGKRLRKSEKNREKRAKKIAKGQLTGPAKKRKMEDVKQPGATLDVQAAQKRVYRGLMPPHLGLGDQQWEKDEGSQNFPGALPANDGFFAPATNSGHGESTIEVEGDEISAVQLDDTVLGYGVINSPDSHQPISPKSCNTQAPQAHKSEAAITIVTHHSTFIAASPQPFTSEDSAVISAALALLLNLSAEQTSLNARTAAIENQISSLQSTRFKLDHTAISKLEREQALTAALSFDLMILEFAFREELEIHREDWSFDLRGALGGMGRRVGECVSKFEKGMMALGVWEIKGIPGMRFLDVAL